MLSKIQILRANVALIAAIAVIVAGTSAVPALADPATDDVNCLVLMSLMVDSGGPQAQAAGTMGSAYFAGKLHALPPAQVTGLAIAQAPAVISLLKSELGRCVSEMEGRVLALRAASGKKHAGASPAPRPDGDLICLAAYAMAEEATGDAAIKLQLFMPSTYYVGKLSSQGVDDVMAQLSAFPSDTETLHRLQAAMPKCDIDYQQQQAAVTALGATLHQSLTANPFSAPPAPAK